MGFEAERFLSEIHEEFHCTICTMILEEPMQSPCEHLFCKECIDGWLNVHEDCPVNCGALKLDDLKPAGRFVRNVLNGLNIKCDNQRDGCQVVVSLEYLQQHLAICEYSPKAESVCDNGCNLKVTRREYETDYCFTPNAKRMRFNEQENKKLNHEVSDQREEITKLKEKNPEHREISLQKWLDVATSNMRIAANILEADNLNFNAWALSIDCLTPASPFFKIKILSVDFMEIGLKSTNTLFQHIFYNSNGWLNGVENKGNGHSFLVDDIIECGIKFSQSSDNVQVYFTHNGRLVEEIIIPNGRYFPSISMGGVNKIEYFSK